MSDRDEYAEVGRAIRQAVQRAVEHRVTACDTSTLLGVIAVVSSYSRLQTHASAREITSWTHFHYRSVLSSLGRLAALQPPVIIWRPARGQRHRSVAGLPAYVSERPDAHSHTPRTWVDDVSESWQ